MFNSGDKVQPTLSGKNKWGRLKSGSVEYGIIKKQDGNYFIINWLSKKNDLLLLSWIHHISDIEPYNPIPLRLEDFV